MIITTVTVPTKEVTLQFTDAEWGVLQWINQNRSQAWLARWFTAQFQQMGQRKEQDMQAEIKRKWGMADQATKDHIKTLLGV